MLGNSGNIKRLPDQVSTQKRRKKEEIVRYRITVIGEFGVSKEEMKRLESIYDKAKSLHDITPLFKSNESVDVAFEEIGEFEEKLIE